MEIWKDIKGYEGYYQISDSGRVKSLKRKAKHSSGNGYRTVNEIILKSIIDASGYVKVNLNKDGKIKTFTVHQLVAITFLNHMPCGHNLVVDHVDNDKLNNNVQNFVFLS